MKNQSISQSLALCSLVALALTGFAPSAVLAEKFPYRTLEVDITPLQPLPEEDIKLSPLLTRSCQTPSASSDSPSASDSQDSERKGWDGTVKGGSTVGGKVKGQVTTSSGDMGMRNEVVEQPGGGTCTDPRSGGKPVQANPRSITESGIK